MYANKKFSNEIFCTPEAMAVVMQVALEMGNTLPEKALASVRRLQRRQTTLDAQRWRMMAEEIMTSSPSCCWQRQLLLNGHTRMHDEHKKAEVILRDER
jgi:hypothetical protein